MEQQACALGSPLQPPPDGPRLQPGGAGYTSNQMTAANLPSICQGQEATGGRRREASRSSWNTNLSSGHIRNHPSPPHPPRHSNFILLQIAIKNKIKNVQFHGAIVDHFNSNPSPVENDRKAIQPSTLEKKSHLLLLNCNSHTGL